jgi:hypothetical protein
MPGKSLSIESMGLESFLNELHGPKGGYKLFVELLTAGKPDSEIAKAFSTENRKLNYQTVANWRRAYIEKDERKEVT